MANPVLQDYQFWFGDASGLLGKTFGIDTEIDVVSVDGLEALQVRSGTREFARQDGSIPGLHLVSSKQPIFELEAIGEEEYSALTEVLRVMPDAEGELHFKYPDNPQRFVRARVLSRTDFRDAFTTGRMPLTVAFEIADPRIYGLILKSANLSQYSPPSESINFPINWNVNYTITASGGMDVIAHNAGDSDAYPTIRFFGPTIGTCEGVKLTNLTTGVVFECLADILSGQILKADMDARKRGSGTRVIELSGSSRYGDWVEPRSTFYLQKGDNVLRLELTGTSSSTDVMAIINWRDTSL